MPDFGQVPVFGEVDSISDLPDRTPIPFKVIGYDVERKPHEFMFEAAATASTGLVLDMAEGTDVKGRMHPSVVSKFFRSVIVEADQERWDQVMHDNDLYFIDTALQQVAEYLADIYVSDEEGSPARPTGQRSALQAGRGTAGTRSTARHSSRGSGSGTPR